MDICNKLHISRTWTWKTIIKQKKIKAIIICVWLLGNTEEQTSENSTQDVPIILSVLVAYRKPVWHIYD